MKIDMPKTYLKNKRNIRFPLLDIMFEGTAEELKETKVTNQLCFTLGYFMKTLGIDSNQKW
jgi:hypothetical protein